MVEDEEVFEWFDAFVDWLKELPQCDTSILNISRVKDMNTAYKLISESLWAACCDAKVSCGYGELGSRIGYVEVEGKSIDLANLGYFAHAANLADNTEVYPLADDRVRMTLTFRKFLLPISSE